MKGDYAPYILDQIKIKNVPPSEAAPSHSPELVRGGGGGRGEGANIRFL